MEKGEKNLRILICDDDPQDRKLIRTYLQMIAGRDVVTLEAGQAAEIQRAIDVEECDIVLMDLRMPEKSGADWLKEIVEKQLAPVVILTGYGDEDVVVQTLQQGAVGYLPKRRLSPESLANTIDDAIEKWRGLMLSRGNFDQLERLASVDSVTGELIRQKFLKTLCKTIGCETMEALATIVEFRDPYTASHQQRVTQLACAIAKAMNFPEDNVTGLYLAGLIHDIGKVSVPSEILCNPNGLSADEFNIIKMHPTLGYEVLKGLDLPWPIAQIVHQHHERLDGSGYPLGLSGEDILLEARILAVADVVEAMASHRPYRPSLGLDRALSEIVEHKGKLYAPDVVDACLRVFRDLAFEFQHGSEELSSSQILLPSATQL
ncbi:HD domain-containing phosphohydrolase [Chloroflexota bacterium]